jgi:hypothetical protein
MLIKELSRGEKPPRLLVLALLGWMVNSLLTYYKDVFGSNLPASLINAKR